MLRPPFTYVCREAVTYKHWRRSISSFATIIFYTCLTYLWGCMALLFVSAWIIAQLTDIFLILAYYSQVSHLMLRDDTVEDERCLSRNMAACSLWSWRHPNNIKILGMILNFQVFYCTFFEWTEFALSDVQVLYRNLLSCCLDTTTYPIESCITIPIQPSDFVPISNSLTGPYWLRRPRIKMYCPLHPTRAGRK